jgi:hypothetical protein
MATLIDSVETEFDTDYAILTAHQEGADPLPGVSYATSVPGFVSLQCGTQHPRVSVRAERWDARPPMIDGWEDFDELPFEEVPNGGDLMLSGFDLSGVALDVEGLGAGRVQVFARGRHRYGYGDPFDPAELSPEVWLLRLFPSPHHRDPMAGGPRRIAGAGEPGATQESPWHAAVFALSSTGWTDVLKGSKGFSWARYALLSAGQPLTRTELARGMLEFAGDALAGPVNAENPEATQIAPPPIELDADPLAVHSGRAIETVADVIDAMLDFGLLLTESRDGRQLLVPNPSPALAWERLALSGDDLRGTRARTLRGDHDGVACDIARAVAWASGAGLRATPRDLAIRWATSIDDVVGAIRLLGGEGVLTSDRDLGFDSEFDPDGMLLLQGEPDRLRSV